MKTRNYLTLLTALCVCLAMVLTACGGNAKDNSGADGKSTVKLGVGCVTDFAMDGTDKATTTATVAAVLLDAEGIIRRCRLEEVVLSTSAAGDITPDFSGKWERGGSYHPTEKDVGGSSELNSSWQEQAQAFCSYVEGKTAMEVGGIAATDGKSGEIPGCDLVITAFIRAVHKAADTAQSQAEATAANVLRLAVTATTNSAATAPQYDVEMAAVTRDDAGRITGCYTDGLQVKLKADGTTVTAAGNMATKRELGDAYNMKSASGIKKEWYEQATAFDRYAVGKTATELSGLKTNAEGKTDAIAGCTMTVTSMLKNTVKAAEMKD